MARRKPGVGRIVLTKDQLESIYAQFQGERGIQIAVLGNDRVGTGLAAKVVAVTSVDDGDTWKIIRGDGSDGLAPKEEKT